MRKVTRGISYSASVICIEGYLVRVNWKRSSDVVRHMKETLSGSDLEPFFYKIIDSMVRNGFLERDYEMVRLII